MHQDSQSLYFLSAKVCLLPGIERYKVLNHYVMFLGGKLKLVWSKIVLTSKETVFFFLHSMDCCSLSSELKESLSVPGTLFHRFHLPSQLPQWELSISPGHKSISTVLVSVPVLGLNKVSPGKMSRRKDKKRSGHLLSRIFFSGDCKESPLSGLMETKGSFQYWYWKTLYFIPWLEAGKFLRGVSLSPLVSIFLSVGCSNESKGAFTFSCPQTALHTLPTACAY